MEFLIKPIAFMSSILMLIIVYFTDLQLVRPTIDTLFPSTDPNIGYINIVVSLFSWVIYLLAIFMVAYLVITREEM